MSSNAITVSVVQAKCSQVDREINERQEEFGVDLYDMLQEHENNSFGKGIVLPGAFPFAIKEEWFQVKEEIEHHVEKYLQQQQQQQKKNTNLSRQKKYGASTKQTPGSFHHNNFHVDQWILRRKQRFGVDCFDTAFEVLGTSSGSNTETNNTTIVSTLSPQEKALHVLVQEAAKDVLILERMKESYLQDIQVTDEKGGGLIPFFCGAIMCC